MKFTRAKYRTDGLRWCPLLLLALLVPFRAQADQIIYSDSRQNSWDDWSWDSIRNFSSTATVHAGSSSLSVTITNAWGALSLEHAAMDASGYTNLSFWINGGPTGGQKLKIYAELTTGVQTAINLPTLTANTWQQLNFSTTALGVANQANFTRFSLQDRVGAAMPVFYVDDIVLQSGPPLPPPPQTTNAPGTATVDVQVNRRAISPMIYGVAFATSNELALLNFTVNRSGGNSETRYNWQSSAHNLGNDWYFESYPDDNATPGSDADGFVANSLAGGAQPMMTIPMIGWMPKLSTGRAINPSYSVAKYGAQTGVDPYLANAGNGVATSTGKAITTNDPNDANFPTNSAFQKNFVQHLISRWGNSTNGGVRYYFMDNEHSLWFSTHRDVHPVGPSMQEIRDKIFDYASMVKSNDPNAVVLGPEEWGWSGYFYSGYDQQNSGFHDRATNGGWDYLPWLLDQMHHHDTNTGQRLLDYFTVHCYPQGGEGGNDVSTGTETLRNQSTRQLWDPAYVDQSWIGQQGANSKIMLIPRMRNWVTNYYPGTKIGITEYNWGAEPYMNGATAQADILGIFGREGLDLGTRWTTPSSNTPTFLAMKMYRNYDGHKSTFGDTSVSATVNNPDNLVAFAAIRTNDSALTVMVVNKMLSGVTPFKLSVTNFASSGTAQAWQLAANVITRLADVSYAGGILSNSLPAQSVTLLVLPTDKNLSLRVGTNVAPRQMELWIDGHGGQRYVLQSSSDLVTWSNVSTNIFTTNSFRLLLDTTNSSRLFYRGVLSSP